MVSFDNFVEISRKVLAPVWMRYGNMGGEDVKIDRITKNNYTHSNVHSLTILWHKPVVL